jgi:hypothetical protein
VAALAGSIRANLYAPAAGTIPGTSTGSVDVTWVLVFRSSAAALGVAHTQTARRQNTKTTLINFIVVNLFLLSLETTVLEMAAEARGERLCG